MKGSGLNPSSWSSGEIKGSATAAAALCYQDALTMLLSEFIFRDGNLCFSAILSIAVPGRLSEGMQLLCSLFL